MSDVEVPLAGGVVNVVVRVGDTVRRTTGPWTPAVHSLLRHLESVGFPYSPRVLGTDDHGREVLSYLEGESSLRPWPAHLRATGGLRDVGRMLRELTTALSTYVPPPDAVWRTNPGPVAIPGSAGGYRHGDVGMWNILWQGERLVGLIDWDFAEPAPPLWDVAQAAWYGIPLFRGAAGWQACGFDNEPDLKGRLEVLCDAYGAEPAAVLDALADLQRVDRERVVTLGRAGVAPFDAFLARGDVAELEEEQARLVRVRDVLLGR